MVGSLKRAVRREGSRDALLQRLEGELDSIYDLIYQVFAEESYALKVLQSTLRKAVKRSDSERYERYLHLWALGITAETIHRSYNRFVSERVEGQEIPFEYLTLEEKLVLFLHDRSHLSYEEIAAVLQISVGRVGRSLTYAREKVAHQALGLHWKGEENLPLRERLAWNRSLDSKLAAETGEGAVSYLAAMSQVQESVASIPARRFKEIESSVTSQKILPLLGRADGWRWQDLSLQYKLGLEASLLGVVGLIAVVVMPWAFSQVNSTAFLEGRFSEVFQVQTVASTTPEVSEITTDRLLASSEGAGEGESGMQEVEDEFANVEFPSGDSYEAGTAPLAPSRQSAAVYRLIVRSPTPQELIPHVRTLFAKKNVRERERSGTVMPGGVFFDGLTNVGTYPQLLQEIESRWPTATYSHPGPSKNPNERARVIVWVQQI